MNDDSEHWKPELLSEAGGGRAGKPPAVVATETPEPDPDPKPLSLLTHVWLWIASLLLGVHPEVPDFRYPEPAGRQDPEAPDIKDPELAGMHDLEVPDIEAPKQMICPWDIPTETEKIQWYSLGPLGAPVKELRILHWFRRWMVPCPTLLVFLVCFAQNPNLPAWIHWLTQLAPFLLAFLFAVAVLGVRRHALGVYLWVYGCAFLQGWYYGLFTLWIDGYLHRRAELSCYRAQVPMQEL